MKDPSSIDERMRQAHEALAPPPEPPQQPPTPDEPSQYPAAKAFRILGDTFTAAVLNSAAAISAVLGPGAPDGLHWLAISAAIITGPWWLGRALLALPNLKNANAAPDDVAAALLLTAALALTLHAAISLGAPVPLPAQWIAWTAVATCCVVGSTIGLRLYRRAHP